jgi:hypothetical protein
MMVSSSSPLLGANRKTGIILKSQIFNILFIVVTLLSFWLRVGLVWFNRQSNDNHMEVVQLMLASARLPQLKDCWECFQPKMFHFTVTMLLRILGMTGLPINGLNLVAEIINLLAGLATVAVAWAFIRRLPVKNKWLQLLAFGLVALNPAMIGINSQATNDTFAILFSSLAIYCTHVFLQRTKLAPFLLAILFTALGIASKTNVWVTAIGIVITLFIHISGKAGRTRRTAGHAIAFLIAVPVLSVINPLTQYAANYQTYGKPVLMNINPLPLPPLTGISKYNDRAGILSVKDGFFTFKFINLFEHPRVEYDHDNYPPNRTSFWTMFYGSANSASFSNFPPSWSTTGTEGFWLTRGIFGLAVLPVILLLVGGLMETFAWLRGFFSRNDLALQKTGYGLFALAFLGYLAFAILYAMYYQTFLVLKAIFIFPALLAFPVFFLRAAEPAQAYLSKHARWSIPIFHADLLALMVLNIIEIVTLIIRIQLYH